MLDRVGFDRGPEEPAGRGDAAITRLICERHGNAPDALIEILHDVQHELGLVPKDVLPVIGEALNLSRAEVHGVVTFYHDFRREPAGRHVLKVCRAEACQSMGAMALITSLENALGVLLGGTSADGSVTVEATYCLGNCALAPAVMIDGKLLGRASLARIEQALSPAANGSAP